jgi:hypothetical protein
MIPLLINSPNQLNDQNKQAAWPMVATLKHLVFRVVALHQRPLPFLDSYREQRTVFIANGMPCLALCRKRTKPFVSTAERCREARKPVTN